MDGNERILTDEQREKLNKISWLTATQNDLQFLRSLSDDQLVVMSMSPDVLAMVESNRRVVNKLKFEGRITIALTVAILCLTSYLVWDATKDKNEEIVRALEKVEKQIEKSGKNTEFALKEMNKQKQVSNKVNSN